MFKLPIREMLLAAAERYDIKAKALRDRSASHAAAMARVLADCVVDDCPLTWEQARSFFAFCECGVSTGLVGMFDIPGAIPARDDRPVQASNPVPLRTVPSAAHPQASGSFIPSSPFVPPTGPSAPQTAPVGNPPPHERGGGRVGPRYARPAVPVEFEGTGQVTMTGPEGRPIVPRTAGQEGGETNPPGTRTVDVIMPDGSTKKYVGIGQFGKLREVEGGGEPAENLPTAPSESTPQRATYRGV